MYVKIKYFLKIKTKKILQHFFFFVVDKFDRISQAAIFTKYDFIFLLRLIKKCLKKTEVNVAFFFFSFFFNKQTK
jgi:hypothetical protein